MISGQPFSDPSAKMGVFSMPLLGTPFLDPWRLWGSYALSLVLVKKDTFKGFYACRSPKKTGW